MKISEHWVSSSRVIGRHPSSNHGTTLPIKGKVCVFSLCIAGFEIVNLNIESFSFPINVIMITRYAIYKKWFWIIHSPWTHAKIQSIILRLSLLNIIHKNFWRNSSQTSCLFSLTMSRQNCEDDTRSTILVVWDSCRGFQVAVSELCKYFMIPFESMNRRKCLALVMYLKVREEGRFAQPQMCLPWWFYLRCRNMVIVEAYSTKVHCHAYQSIHFPKQHMHCTVGAFFFNLTSRKPASAVRFGVLELSLTNASYANNHLPLYWDGMCITPSTSHTWRTCIDPILVGSIRFPWLLALFDYLYSLVLNQSAHDIWDHISFSRYPPFVFMLHEISIIYVVNLS